MARLCPHLSGRGDSALPFLQSRECRVFFAQSSRPGPDFNTLYRHNVDSMLVAEAGSFDYRNFVPLYRDFGVSVTAMAIQLEDLDLVT